MNHNCIYLSTMDSNAPTLARHYGFGLEIAEYCTAWNMDEHYSEVHPRVMETIKGIPHRILHAPFNELFPCAIDPKARQLAQARYQQAIILAGQYGAGKVVIHGGYNPKMYYAEWYINESVGFWRNFLQDNHSDAQIVLENVLEEDPRMLLDIVKSVNDSRLKLCLDVGHVNAYSRVPVMEWLEVWAPWLSHFHIHNNDGSWDTHSALNEGTIPMREFLRKAETLCPEATFTLELPDGEASVQWLMEEMQWN